MQENLTSLVERLDEARKDVLSRLQGIEPSRLAFSPHGGWSPLAIVEHLILSERALFAPMRSPAGCRHVKPTVAQIACRLAMSSILRWRIPVPVPDERMEPSGTVSLETLATMWGDDLAWLREFVNGATPATLGYACFSHPVAGPLTPAQALKLAVLHVGYHLPVIDRGIG